MIELARYASPFGAIRIVERASDGARFYYQAGGLQTLAYADGTSLFGYIHALEVLARDGRRVLILGGAGGSLATMLARRGCMVTVVDIDPLAERIARTFFGLDPRVTWITQDAIDFIAAGASGFDVLVVDAFDSRGLSRMFTHADGVASAASNLAPDGWILVNLAGFDGPVDYAWPLACALTTSGWRATLFRADEGPEGNELLWAARGAAPPTMDISDLKTRPAETHTYLMSLHPIVAPDGAPS